MNLRPSSLRPTHNTIKPHTSPSCPSLLVTSSPKNLKFTTRNNLVLSQAKSQGGKGGTRVP